MDQNFDDEREQAREMLELDEGNTEYPIDCKTGKKVEAPLGRVTIGIGHNLQDNPLSEEVILFLFYIDLKHAYQTAQSLVPGLLELERNRRLAIVNMAFNLGYHRLKGFESMLEAVNDGRWEHAAHHARNSHWFVQVGDRAKRVVLMLEHNTFPYGDKKNVH